MTKLNENLTVGIVGLGLIGGSIAKDLHEIDPSIKILAFDSDKNTLDKAVEDGHIDGSHTIQEVSRLACITIIATPIKQIAPTALEIRDALKEDPGASHESRKLVLDVASVKKPITNVFSVLGSVNVEFVATHPMAGTEFSGFNHARKGLFRSKPWIICPHENSSAETINYVKDFLDGFGAYTRTMDADTHDRHAAAVSHSVIVLSNLILEFIADKHPEALELAGDGFNSTTRLASGNPEMHASIVEANKGFVFQYLDEFIEYAYGRIDLLRDTDDTHPFFSHNAEERNDWLKNRKNL